MTGQEGRYVYVIGEGDIVQKRTVIVGPQVWHTAAPTEGKQGGLQWERWQRVHLDDLLDGMTPMEFILRFTFTHPDLHTNIVGTINPAHLHHNVSVLRQGPLGDDVYAEAKRRLDAAGSTPRGV